MPTRPRSMVEEEWWSELATKSTVVQAPAAHEEHEATRPSAEETAAEAAASVSAAFDCWRAAEAQLECGEVLDNLLRSVENFDNQVHSTTMREDSFVSRADGWFRDFRHAMGSHIVQAPPVKKVELKLVSGAPQLGRTEPDKLVPGRDASSWVSDTLGDRTPRTRNWHRSHVLSTAAGTSACRL